MGWGRGWTRGGPQSRSLVVKTTPLGAAGGGRGHRSVSPGPSEVRKAFDDFGFCGDRSVVCSGNPASIFAFQSCTAHKDILYSLVENVSHVQHSGHVRWRNNYRERFSSIRLAMKKFVVQPVFIPACFDVSRIVFCFHIYIYKLISTKRT